MIRFSVWLLLIAHSFIFTKTEPLLGEHVFPADPLEYPFVASLGLKYPYRPELRQHFCNGSLITKQHIVTAAHCFAGITKDEVDVIVGDADLKATNLATYQVDSWVTYNDWARKNGKSIESMLNDVAIVTLSSMVNRDDIKPVALTPLNDQQLYRTRAFMAGWGRTNENALTNVLLKGKVTILTIDKCKHQLKLVSNRSIRIKNNYLCTLTDPYILSGCKGDSGGPLLDKDNFLLGITSSTCPNAHWGNFSEEFLKQYKVNLHSSVNYYRVHCERDNIILNS